MPVAKLVIGPAKPGEISRNDCNVLPHVLRQWLRNWHSVLAPSVVATYSPIIIDEFQKIWEAYAFEFIVLRRPGERNLYIDTPLLQAKPRDWLAHFSIADLYMRDELRQWLSSSPREDSDA